MVGDPLRTWHAPAEGMDFKPLSELDRTILGGRRECRINIPVVSRYDLRVVADAIRELASVLDFESRRQDVPERSSLFRVQEECRLVNWRIQEHFAPIYEQLRIPAPRRGGRKSGRDDDESAG